MVHLLMTLALVLICNYDAAAAPRGLTIYYKSGGENRQEIVRLVELLQKEFGTSRNLRFSLAKQGSDYELEFSRKKIDSEANDDLINLSASLVPINQNLSNIVATGQAPSVEGAIQDVVNQLKEPLRGALIALEKGEDPILSFVQMGPLSDPQDFCHRNGGRLPYAHELVQARVALETNRIYYVADKKYQDVHHYLVKRETNSKITYEVKWSDGGEANATVIYCMKKEAGLAPREVLCAQEIYRICRGLYMSDQKVIEDNCGLLIAKADAFGSKALKDTHAKSDIDSSKFKELSARAKGKVANAGSLETNCSHLINSKEAGGFSAAPGLQ